MRSCNYEVMQSDEVMASIEEDGAPTDTDTGDFGFGGIH